MRLLAVGLLIGMIAGAIAGALGFRMIRQWHLHQEAVMTLLQTNLAALRRELEAGRCTSDGVARALGRLDAVASEIEEAFLPPGTEEPRFRDLSRRLQAVLAEVRAQPPGDCEALARARARIGEGCKACHDVYRG